MLSKFAAWLKRRCPVLFEDKMPVWLTILASIAAATATYYIAPLINRQFQLDDARASHLRQTTQGLNQEIIELSQKIRRLNSALVNAPTTASPLREECLDGITKLQWRLIDLRAVLNTGEDSAAVDRLEAALEGVQGALNRAVDARGQEPLLQAMNVLAREARNVLGRLYETAQLK